jgi:hypothetical protein
MIHRPYLGGDPADVPTPLPKETGSEGISSEIHHRITCDLFLIFCNKYRENASIKAAKSEHNSGLPNSHSVLIKVTSLKKKSKCIILDMVQGQDLLRVFVCLKVDRRQKNSFSLGFRQKNLSLTAKASLRTLHMRQKTYLFYFLSYKRFDNVDQASQSEACVKKFLFHFQDLPPP